ncbi:MAG: hypothetical protein WC333_02245 [Dehalococcoidia bacterium]|jgi:hypothetical protein
MKRFNGNIIYRGRSLDVEFCAKTIKEAARILDSSEHYVRKYMFYSPVGEGGAFTGVNAVPYGYQALLVLEKGKEYDLNEAKRLIDEYAKKKMDEMLTEQS